MFLVSDLKALFISPFLLGLICFWFAVLIAAVGIWLAQLCSIEVPFFLFLFQYDILACYDRCQFSFSYHFLGWVPKYFLMLNDLLLQCRHKGSSFCSSLVFQTKTGIDSVVCWRPRVVVLRYGMLLNQLLGRSSRCSTSRFFNFLREYCSLVKNLNWYSALSLGKIFPLRTLFSLCYRVACYILVSVIIWRQ